MADTNKVTDSGEIAKLKEQKTLVRGIRGATTAGSNQAVEIHKATGELLEEIVKRNRVKPEMIAAIFFSATPDLNSAFPAKAARQMGWTQVPLFCQVEIDVPEAIHRCIRVLILINTDLGQDEVEHVYLKDTKKLREL